MFVKPGPDRERPGSLLKVRIPRTHALLSDDGAEVPEDAFWLQRVRHGDVVVVNTAVAATTVIKGVAVSATGKGA